MLVLLNIKLTIDLIMETLFLQTVSSPDFEIFNSDIGTYEIQVFSTNAALQTSATSADLTFNAVGKTAIPANVTGLNCRTNK